jgi:CDP-glucose 4,6-dehydratase
MRPLVDELGRPPGGDLDIARWRGRRVLVTGHSGFIGSWLSVALLQLGAQVAGLSSSAGADTGARAHWLTALGVTDRRADIRDLSAVRAALAAEPVDAVIHLAAQPLVGVGFDDPCLRRSACTLSPCFCT